MLLTVALIIISFLLFALSFLGTRAFVRWSLKRGFPLDIPNERSSHTKPVPRGGGIVFATICLSSILIYGAVWNLPILLYFFLGGIIVTIVSWIDDLLSLPVWLRFLTHSITASLVIYLLGYWESLYFPILGEMRLGKLGAVLTFFWIVWVINACNFMDGIDGLVSLIAITAGLGWLAVGLASGDETIVFLSFIVIASVSGFLTHNWSPAKVFMGDVGSVFLGYFFAVMPLLASRLLQDFQQTHNGFWLAFAVFCLFLIVFDTAFTLIRRVLHKERVWQAHRSHLYQRLVRGGWPHKKAATLYGALSLIITGSAVLAAFLRDYETIPVILSFLSAFFLIIVVDRLEKKR